MTLCQAGSTRISSAPAPVPIQGTWAPTLPGRPPWWLDSAQAGTSFASLRRMATGKWWGKYAGEMCLENMLGTCWRRNILGNLLGNMLGNVRTCCETSGNGGTLVGLLLLRMVGKYLRCSVYGIVILTSPQMHPCRQTYHADPYWECMRGSAVGVKQIGRNCTPKWRITGITIKTWMLRTIASDWLKANLAWLPAFFSLDRFMIFMFTRYTYGLPQPRFQQRRDCHHQPEIGQKTVWFC